MVSVEVTPWREYDTPGATPRLLLWEVGERPIGAETMSRSPHHGASTVHPRKPSHETRREE